MVSEPSSIARPTVLVTGFEPFGDSTLNPSRVVVEALASMDEPAGRGEGFAMHTAELPVDTERIASVLARLWREVEPDVALHFGESARAERVTLERVAINLLDFEVADNAGRRVVDEPIDPDGPAARFATLPVRTIKSQLDAQYGIASDLSLSAGAYLCNQTLYLSLGHAERRGGRAGFVHLPSLPEQVRRGERDEPSLPSDRLIEAAIALVKLAAGHGSDKNTRPGVEGSPELR
ncbi:MAG: pyroglutamyl-peptidase I [Phycisphaeraceae bacterium]